MQAISLNASFDFSDGGKSPGLVQSWGSSDPVQLTHPETPAWDGYQLLGWYTEDGHRWDFDHDLLTGSIHLTARWADGDAFSFSNSKQYFDPNGA